MRSVLVCSLLVLSLAGCGGGAGSPAAQSSSAASGSSASTPAASPSDDGGSSSPGGGGGDCSALTKDDIAAFVVGTQLLAQVRDKETLDSITSGQIGRYDPDSFGAVLAKMSFLSGDAGDGLAKLVAANDAVKKLASGTPAQADFDAYQSQTGGIAGILKAQLAVNLGLSKQCPSLG